MSEVESERFLDTLRERDSLPSTDEVLSRVLPLLEQAANDHARGLVAPLSGVESIRSVGGRLFYASNEATEPRRSAALHSTRVSYGAVEVHSRLRTDDDGSQTDLSIGDLDTPSDVPVYLPRFVAWEHTKEHHDALADIYVLGLVLASVALHVDLGDPEELASFVANRRALTSLHPKLHPVVARVITTMTELDRRARAQDLPSVIHALVHHRDQRIEVEPAPEAKNEPRKRRILRRLRDRLFDFSRRNRLLHFRAGTNTLDLTATSIPMLLDVTHVDPNAIFLAEGASAADLLSQKAFPLGRYVRFEDYPFAGASLDAIRLEARRCRAELGFSQLRLVVCFLHWYDLVDAPKERITSPLLLLPVELEKKRGVREAHTLRAATSTAEVNPVLAQYLRQRHGIRLPTEIDLTEPGALAVLHRTLEDAIRATEPGVTLELVSRPRIDLIQATVRRRLEAYRKRARLSGRDARSKLGLDYSYVGPSPRPLGIQLFRTFVEEQSLPDSVMHAPPRPQRSLAAPSSDEDAVTKMVYRKRSSAEDADSYHWSFDLTSLTLAHFNYQNVSLVRDYAALIDPPEGAATSDAVFEELFREEPRPLSGEITPLVLEERHDVVLADPTQSAAVARARSGASFVIQGPPGTGKSQTITNLIADSVANGRRVLFVCEKRAALDVVHSRLVKVGLGPLCCLVHDAQEDKKPFLKDLKGVYESWLEAEPGTVARDARTASIAARARLAARASRLQTALDEPCEPGTPAFRELCRRAVTLREGHAVAPVADVPSLPGLKQTLDSLESVARVEAALRAVGHTSTLGTHPSRRLSADWLSTRASLDERRATLRSIVDDLRAIAQTSALAVSGASTTWNDVAAMHGFARSVRPLLVPRLVALFDATSALARRVTERLADLHTRARHAASAREAASGWRDALGPADASTALTLARQFESGFLARLFRWLSPAWWRLRRTLRARFDVTSRAVLGDWTPVLEALVERHRAEAATDEVRALLRDEVGAIDPDEVRTLLSRAEAPADRDRAARLAHLDALRVEALGATLDRTSALASNLGGIVVGARETLGEVITAFDLLVRDASVLQALSGPLVELGTSHPDVDRFLRTTPVDRWTMESLVVENALAAARRMRAPDLVLEEGHVDDFGRAAADAEAAARRASAPAIVESIRERFRERSNLVNLPAAGLDASQKAVKRLYTSGRRELEHELGKVMRHKTIREIVSSPAGAVVRDLKPIWLMSPLSVADVLPLEPFFDVVVFDEASQIPLEDAIPAIHRATQCIVVGDRQQLPPTEFFGSRGADEEEDDEELLAVDDALDADSLLTHCDRALPSTMLGWHYRSRHESLIDFSNRLFYAGRLLTIPSTSAGGAHAPIRARAPYDGTSACEAATSRPITFHLVEDGVYDARTNEAEARYVAEMVRRFLAKGSGDTLGIVAFSEAQQRTIEQALDRLAEEDADFRTRYEAECNREDEGQFVGLFVKNLENVQGDERDVVIVSICYAPDRAGRMLMNFGPINRKGGERRLNVIFSRAKKHVAVVSTITSDRITNDYNDGASCLKRYLRYAEACSVGDGTTATGALRGSEEREEASGAAADPVVAALANALRARGFVVETELGRSSLRCNLAIREPHDAEFRLGVLVDTRERARRPSDESLRIEPEVLRAFGWKVTTVLTSDWYEDRDGVLARVERLSRGA